MKTPDPILPAASAQPAPAARPESTLAALADLMGRVAPPLNALLTVVTGRTALLLESESIAGADREALDQVFVAGEKAVALVRQLQLFSGREDLRARPVDVNAVIAEVREVLRRLCGSAIRLEIHLAARLPAVSSDAELLEQMIIGLALNSIDAMPAGGALVIGTRVVSESPLEKERVEISVADTGEGIPAEIRPQIFEPFFTTRESGRGTGLGLAAIQGLVRQHGGTIDLGAEMAGGCTFRVLLPAAGCALAEPRPGGTAPVVGNGALILLVDDDPPVREFTAAALRTYGYRVLQAASIPDALEAWKWHGARIKLLITDVALDGRSSGLDLAAQLRTAAPALPVICLSGLSRQVLARSGVEAGYQFVAKPCRPQALARVVNSMLELQP